MLKLEQVTREELTKKTKSFFSFGRVGALTEGEVCGCEWGLRG